MNLKSIDARRHIDIIPTRSIGHRLNGSGIHPPFRPQPYIRPCHQNILGLTGLIDLGNPNDTTHFHQRNGLVQGEFNIDLLPSTLAHMETMGILWERPHQNLFLTLFLVIPQPQEQRGLARHLHLNLIQTRGNLHLIFSTGIGHTFHHASPFTFQGEETHRNTRCHLTIHLNPTANTHQRHGLTLGQRYVDLLPGALIHKETRGIFRSLNSHHRALCGLPQEQRGFARQLHFYLVQTRGYVDAVVTRSIGRTLNPPHTFRPSREQAHIGAAHRHITLISADQHRTTQAHQRNRLTRLQHRIHDLPAIPAHKKVGGLLPTTHYNHRIRRTLQTRRQAQEQGSLARQLDFHPIETRGHIDAILALGIGHALDPPGIIFSRWQQAYFHARYRIGAYLDRTTQRHQRHRLTLGQRDVQLFPVTFLCPHKKAKRLIRGVLHRHRALRRQPQKQGGLTRQLDLNLIQTRGYLHVIPTFGIRNACHPLGILHPHREQAYLGTPCCHIPHHHRTLQPHQGNRLIRGQHHVYLLPSILAHKEAKGIFRIALNDNMLFIHLLVKIHAQEQRSLAGQPYPDLIGTGHHVKGVFTLKIGHTLNHRRIGIPRGLQEYLGSFDKLIPHADPAAHIDQRNRLILSQHHMRLFPVTFRFAHKETERFVRAALDNDRAV